MTAKRLYLVLSASVLLLVAGTIATIIYGTKFLDKQNLKLAASKEQVAQLDTVQSSLANAKRDIELYREIEQIAKAVVPQEKDQSRTVREIIQIANQNNIGIASVGFSSSTLGTKKGAGQEGNTQTEKVEGIQGVERLPITITSDSNRPVSYANLVKFIDGLERNRRTSQVADINIQPDTKNRNLVSFSLKLNVYIKK